MGWRGRALASSGPSELSGFKLPSGRHGLPAQLVKRNQRRRLLLAAAELLPARDGGHGLSSAAIASRAGVSKTTFYKHFANVDACLLAAHTLAVESVWAVAAAACAEVGEDRRVRAVLEAVLALLAAEPGLAQLLSAGVAAGQPAIGASRERLIDRFAVGVRRPLVAGAFALLSDRVAAGEVARLSEFAPELVAILGHSGRDPG